MTMNENNKIRKSKYRRYTPMEAWTLVIFLTSTPTTSSSLSSCFCYRLAWKEWNEKAFGYSAYRG